jgi:hypothetical protein
MGSLISIIKRACKSRADDFIDGEYDDHQEKRDAREKWHAQQKERYWKWKKDKRDFQIR